MRAYRIAYDGRNYHGFQRQPDVPTIEDVLLEACRDIDVCPTEAETPPGYTAAGRTDAGASATAQTIAFEAPTWLDPPAFNSRLPAAIRAWASAAVSDTFHATHDASSREYTYFLFVGGRDWDVARARECLDRLAGSHDFHNLTPDETGTERTLRTGLTVEDEFIQVTVRAGGFPRQLVRRLLTVVDDIATGERELEFVDRVLDQTPLSGPAGIGPASARPLVLTDVEYPGVSFRPAAGARSPLLDRHRELRTAARVLETLAKDR